MTIFFAHTSSLPAQETLDHIGWSEFAPIHAACMADKPSFLTKNHRNDFGCGCRDGHHVTVKFQSHEDHIYKNKRVLSYTQ